MSTEITSTDSPKKLFIAAQGGSFAYLLIGNRGNDQAIAVLSADLFDAIRTELGAIVIDKAQRPVTESEAHYFVGHHTFRKDYHTAESARVAGEELLSLAAYLEANPPVDPKVQALARVLRDGAPVVKGGATWEHAADQDHFLAAAARLLATGRIDIKDAP